MTVKTVMLWSFCKRHIFLIVLVTFLLSFAQAEKEPVEADNVKSDNPPSVRGDILEYGDRKGGDGGKKSNLGFIHAFIASISVIIVSELGDKTFFIAAIMAMRHPRLTVFLGALTALALMTVLSVVFGWAATIIPHAYTYYISTALFALFGLKMLKEGYYMSPNEAQEEFEEVQSDLRKREDEYEKEASSSLMQDPESGIIRKSVKPTRTILSLISRIFIQAFTLTFVAEWGDRSQLTTIILAAREDVVGVTIGGILGHALCTGLAVLGGRMIAQKISVRTGRCIPFVIRIGVSFLRMKKERITAGYAEIPAEILEHVQ
ncbi:putative divalent cation/proton antiporter TMEM165 isoform X2 [Periplaneta americana]|uniref:putative divalent cation/proton antiporter TMEM165 isoform X2 n=1 Tax=Periplaneta americana TaxID=6978 RepID=UPI0037E9C9AD